MGNVRRSVLFTCLLLPSLACVATGIWLGYQAALTRNPHLGRWGEILFLGGMTVVPTGLWFLANCFLRSRGERLRFRQPRNPRSEASLKRKEKSLRRMYFLRRHPSAAILFCLVALIVSGVMAGAPVLSPNDRNDFTLLVLGVVLGPAYFVALLVLVYAILTKKWEPYMDASIQKLETQLTRAKLENKTGSHA